MEHNEEHSEHHGGGCKCGGHGGGCMGEKKVRKMAVFMASQQLPEDASLEEVLKNASKIADFILDGKL